MDELNTCPQGSCNMEGPVTSVDRADRVDPQPRVPKARATVSVVTLVEMLPLHALVLTSIFGIVASVPPHVLSELGAVSVLYHDTVCRPYYEDGRARSSHSILPFTELCHAIEDDRSYAASRIGETAASVHSCR
ncbi:MAG: hypothetical protein ABFD13_02105 [Candidatus Cryosericum sp.]|nr:hypothetical protein [bacterium]